MQMPTHDTTPDAPLAERVHARLREEILTARRAAGSTMRERDVADELGVSRVPVRAALPRLANSGLVVIAPRRPAVITSVSMHDVAQLFDLRTAFEPGLTRLAARAVSEGANGRDLEEALDDAETALTDGHDEALQAANTRVHEAIVHLTCNTLAPTMHAFLDDRVERLNRVSFHHDNARRHHEHVEMARAVLAGREDVAHAATIIHVDHERERVLDSLPHHPHFAGY